MANKKRSVDGYYKKLSKHRFNRTDILAIEKMLRSYSDAVEMKFSGLKSLPYGRKHMTRKYTDRHIQIGRYKPFSIDVGWNHFGWSRAGVKYIHVADSVSFLPKSINTSRYVEISCKPGITICIKPFSTEIRAQTQYATGIELKTMRSTIAAIEKYMDKLPSAKLNKCSL